MPFRLQREHLLERLGLEVKDLYPEPSRMTNPSHGVLHTYEYIDLTGEILYEIRRYDRTRSKFRPFHPHPTTGAMTPGLPKTDPARILYRLLQIVAADRQNQVLWPICICEGERDADTLAERCVPMLTTTVASGSWLNVDTSVLAGRPVVVIVDNDPAGWRRGVTSADDPRRHSAVRRLFGGRYVTMSST